MRKTLLLAALGLSLSAAASAQTLTEVILPQYMQGLNGTNANRVPYVFRATLSGLTPSTTYRYFNLAVGPSDGATSNGAGIPYFLSPGGFTFNSTGTLGTAGQYAELTTDATGSYTGWFGMAPSGNATRFTPGTVVNMRIMLNNGAGGTAVVTRLTTTSGVTVLNFAATATANDASFLWGVSDATARSFAFLYDNTAGTGRPLAGTYIESDGIANTTANSNLAAYANNVEGVAGAWGAIIPNVNANGVQRFEVRNPDGSISASNTTTRADGVWPGPDEVLGTGDDVNTVNPTFGAAGATLPVELVSFTAAASGTDAVVRWSTASETNNAAFAIEALRGTAWTEVATVAGRGTTSERADYETRVSGLGTGRHTLRLVQRDVDGTATVAGTVELVIGGERLTAEVRGTSVRFSAPSSQALTVEAFDVLGRRVATLFSGTVEAGSVESVELSGVASGVYVVRVSGRAGMASTTAVVR